MATRKKKTEAQEAPQQVVPAAPGGDLLSTPWYTTLWIPRTNYRKAENITSHKPRGRNASLEADNARVYTSMLERSENGQQPWNPAEPAQGIPVESAKAYLGVTDTEIADTLRTFIGTVREQYYAPSIKDPSKVLYIGLSGFKRQHTLADVLTDAKVRPTEVFLPLIVEQLESASDYYRLQTYENEGKGVGASKTSTVEQFGALLRAIDSGAIVAQESDIRRVLGVGRGMTQQLWSTLMSARLLDMAGRDGTDRLQMEPPTDPDEASVYSPTGYIPPQKLDKGLAAKTLQPFVDAWQAAKRSVGPAREAAQEALDKIVADLAPKLEDEIAKVITGSNNKPKMTTRTEFEKFLSACGENSFGHDMATAILTGKFVKFAEQNGKIFRSTVDELLLAAPKGA